MQYTATYSPDDNKVRLYASSRLDKETYASVKAAGFRWAPRQELFVAPAWTPSREDLLIELAGGIGDEDTSLVDRAEERADRFEEYSDKRMSDAERARESVSAIADNIPLGQPILVGHHSERHARKDAERIESGMRKAVKMWETSKYWTARAAGALQHAKYKELPAVRHRRIKTLEAEKRKVERAIAESATKLKMWSVDGLTLEQARKISNYANPGVCKQGDGRFGYWNAYDVLRPDGERYAACPSMTVEQVQEAAKRAYCAGTENRERWIAHYDNRLLYERAMLAEQLGADGGSENAMADRFDLKPGGKVLVRDGWLVILKVNKANGVVNSVTTVAPASVTWTGRWKHGIEKIKDYQPPTEEMAAKVKKATTLPPICNYPGEGFREMTEAEWKARKKWSDFPYIGIVRATETAGAHRVRQMPRPGEYFKKQQVYVTDSKRVDPPAPAPKPDLPRSEPAPMTGYTAPRPRLDDPKDADFRAIQDVLKAGGVQIVTAPQLFPTPPAVASQMVQLAGIHPDHRVLEPSAGTGNIVKAIIESRVVCEKVAVEISVSLCAALRRLTPDPVYCNDFLECKKETLGEFDRVLMNPPFERAVDIAHIKHALTFLKPGGRLVAICANGTRQQFHLRDSGLASEWIDLPPGTFKDQGTMVNTAIVVIDV